MKLVKLHLISTDIGVKLCTVPICIRIGIGIGSVETVLNIIILAIGMRIGIGVWQWKHTIMVRSHCPTPTPTLTQTQTQTRIGSIGYNSNLCLCRYLCSVNTSIQFYATHFLSVSVSVSVSGIVNRPLEVEFVARVSPKATADPLVCSGRRASANLRGKNPGFMLYNGKCLSCISFNLIVKTGSGWDFGLFFYFRLQTVDGKNKVLPVAFIIDIFPWLYF